MTIRHHHPAADVLADYARGALHPGAALVVSCHIHGCDTCRREATVWETIGGTLLHDSVPAPLSDDALERALARIGNESSAQRRPAKPRIPRFLDRFDVSAPLREQDIGFRRWLTPNIWFAPIHMGSDSDTRTYLVYANKNTTFPRHTHKGREFTTLLYGSYCDDLGRFDAGDFVEADDDVFHAPAVTPASECLCLSSADAPMRLLSLPARMIQALAGNRY